MAEFTFDLNQLKAGSTRATSNIESGLYSNTKDEDLIYTGNDTIVWDRSNAERLRRGLPSLAAIGYPRPPEDETATQPAPSTATQSNSPNLSSVYLYPVSPQAAVIGVMLVTIPGMKLVVVLITAPWMLNPFVA